MDKIFFIGAGRMAAAMLAGMLTNGLITPAQACCVSGTGAGARNLTGKFGLVPECEAEDFFDNCGTVILACKPQQLTEVAKAWSKGCAGKRIVSILAGRSLDRLRQAFPDARTIIRAMPNTPGAIGFGVTGACFEHTATKADREFATTLLRTLGIVVPIAEEHMDALTAVSGCGPAFVFEFTAALRDGGIALGLDPAMAGELAIHTVLGAARLMIESGETPEALTRAVASPGGTTQAGLDTLAAANLRGILRDTTAATVRRAAEIARMP